MRRGNIRTQWGRWRRTRKWRQRIRRGIISFRSRVRSGGGRKMRRGRWLCSGMRKPRHSSRVREGRSNASKVKRLSTEETEKISGDALLGEFLPHSLKAGHEKDTCRYFQVFWPSAMVM